MSNLRYPRNRTTLSAHGEVPYNRAPPGYEEDCCPDPLCPTICTLACSFVDSLPTGPMWDNQKAEAIRYLMQSGSPTFDPCNPDPHQCPEGPPCPTMAFYAIYVARVLFDVITNIVWPSIRESQAHTAATTVDDWLERYGWEDCFRRQCQTVRSVALSPYSQNCPPQFSDEFEAALAHATLQALVRSSRAGVKNMATLNWIIEPLGMALRPRAPITSPARNADGTPNCDCEGAHVEIYPTTEELPGAPRRENGACSDPRPTVAAAQTYQCEQDGIESHTLYPGAAVAECILRSILTKQCPNFIFRA